ncbi:hypothetical protein AB0C18_30420 [Nonomuraea muscovyensis]|uniref:hypothetical protein n=1 Tax=Nonomuraea muscovyensis TaxID=1124761 RepID=UPI0034064F88
MVDLPATDSHVRRGGPRIQRELTAYTRAAPDALSEAFLAMLTTTSGERLSPSPVSSPATGTPSG